MENSKYNWLLSQKEEMLKNDLTVQIVDTETLRIDNFEMVWLEKDRSIALLEIDEKGLIKDLKDLYVYKITNKNNIMTGYVIEVIFEKYNLLYLFKRKGETFILEVSIKQESYENVLPTYERVDEKDLDMILFMNKLVFEMIKETESLRLKITVGDVKIFDGNPFDTLMKIKKDLLTNNKN